MRVRIRKYTTLRVNYWKIETKPWYSCSWVSHHTEYGKHAREKALLLAVKGYNGEYVEVWLK